MRPEDLQSPFKDQASRKTLIQDRVWYIFDSPENDFIFPRWDDPLLFGNSNPIHIEFCSGNGAWIADKAIQNPHINWIALEKKYSRVKKIWAKIKNHNLSNLIVIAGEALFSLKTYLPDGFASEAYINFPDPWPKRRHAGNRLVQENFIGQVDRILKENCSFYLVTDDPNYSLQFIKEMGQYEGFCNQYEEGFSLEIPDYGRASYFEGLWREKGKTIRYHHYKTSRTNEQRRAG